MQLRDTSLHQARTVNDLHQQQVLDNLAMFFHDPNAMPYFVWLGAGQAQITDQGQAMSTTVWQRLVSSNPIIHGWTSTNLALGGQRTILANWQLTAINDPRKLQLMRCAYQQVVRSCVAHYRNGCQHVAPGTGVCPDCAKLFNAFYTGSPEKAVPYPGSPEDNGGISNLCLGSRCHWLGWGRKKDVPKLCPCGLVGHYCGTYIWVLPGGREELTKLTMAILDYAVNPPAPAPAKPPVAMKEVMVSVNVAGMIVSRNSRDAVGTVKATIPVNAPITAVLSPAARKVRLTQIQKELSTLRDEVAQKTGLKLTHGSLTAGVPAKTMKTLTPAQREVITKATQIARTLDGENRALSEPVPELAPRPLYQPQRGPSLDELNLGFGTNIRSLLLPLQQPPAPLIRP
jgi:hypothetical protein